jgi:hypothetical protein
MDNRSTKDDGLVKLLALPAALVVMGLFPFPSQAQRASGRCRLGAAPVVPSRSKEFERPTDIDVKMEGHRSIQVVRHVTEIDDRCRRGCRPVSFLARMPDRDARWQGPYADWAIGFATNQVGIAYTPASKYAGESSAEHLSSCPPRCQPRAGRPPPRRDGLSLSHGSSARPIPLWRRHHP